MSDKGKAYRDAQEAHAAWIRENYPMGLDTMEAYYHSESSETGRALNWARADYYDNIPSHTLRPTFNDLVDMTKDALANE